jgi:hypothetical protein
MLSSIVTFLRSDPKKPKNGDKFTKNQQIRQKSIQKII